MFAIYPAVDADNARDHAVVFTTDIDLAGILAYGFYARTSTKHEAYLVFDSWPDAKLVNRLNGCHEDIYFSTRVPQSAHDASMWVRSMGLLECVTPTEKTK